MERPPAGIADNSKDSLESYLVYMWRGYYKWYEESVERCRRLLLILQCAVFASGFGTAILAALSNEEWFRENAVLRTTLIVLPLIGTFASGLIASSRLAERLALRERGRQSVQQLVDDGRQRFAAAKSAEEYSEIHKYLVGAIFAVENSQAILHDRIVVSHVASGTHGPSAE